MARAQIKHEPYHCDGFYYPLVCPSKGTEDVADNRHDRHGWLRQSRCFCNTFGISPFDNGACPHCVEFKKFFRKPRRELNARVRA